MIQVNLRCAGYQYPVCGKIQTSSGIWYIFAGYLSDSTGTYTRTIEPKNVPFAFIMCHEFVRQEQLLGTQKMLKNNHASYHSTV